MFIKLFLIDNAVSARQFCSWCNQPLRDNWKHDVSIMHGGSGWIFCSWKCAYQFIKNEIIHTI